MTSLAHIIMNFKIVSVTTLSLMLIQRGFVQSGSSPEDLLFMY